MTRSTTFLHLRPELYCLFCRKTLPGARNHGLKPETNEPASEWEFPVISFCCVPGGTSTEHSQVDTFLGRLDDGGFLQVSTTLRHQHRDSVRVELCFSGDPCKRCDMDNLVFYAHRSCWKLAYSRGYGPLTGRTLYSLGRQTRPMTDWRRLMDLNMLSPQTWDLELPRIVAHSNTSLGHLLRCLARLPPELRQAISSHLQGSFVLSLLACNDSLRLLRFIKSHTYGTRKVVVCPEKPINTCALAIRARFTYIFGSEYLRRLELVDMNRSGDGAEGKVEATSCIDVAHGYDAVSGLEVVLGAYGLRAIRVLFHDGSSSPWLGNPSKGWYATLYGNSIDTIWATQDDLRILRVGFEKGNSKQSVKVFWRDGQDKSLFAKQKLQIVDTRPDLPLISHHSQWRFASCLYIHHEPTTAVTIRCNTSGISAIMTGDLSMQSWSRVGVAYQKGVVVTFPLSRHERINSIHLCISSTGECVMFGPYLLIGTSRQRYRFFGPYMFPMLPTADWIPLTCPELGTATSVVVDMLAQTATRFGNLGVSIDTQRKTATAPENSTPTFTIPQQLTDFTRRSAMGTYFSSAMVAHVKSLEVLKDGPRCLGLYITHIDETSEILGQWDPLIKAQSGSCIIHHLDEDGPLQELSFYFSETNGRPFVSDIRAHDGHGTNDVRYFSKQELSECRLGWWFTRLADDVGLTEVDTRNVDLSESEYSKMYRAKAL